MKGITVAMRINRFLLKLLRYKIDWINIPPEAKKCVLLFAPHTSMLDFVIGKMSLTAMGVKTVFLIKKEVFFFPLGQLLRALGGMPIDRKHVRKFPLFVTNLIVNSDEIAFLVAPEGTRKRTCEWKRGFYFIAQQARVPIVLGYLDYVSRRGGVGHAVWPSGNMDADIAEMQKYYYGLHGRNKGMFHLEEKPYAHPEWLTDKQKEKVMQTIGIEAYMPPIAGREIVFATHNLHKKEEAQAILGCRFVIKSLHDLNFHEEISETADTLKGNAWQKARFAYEKFGCSCFADDTGLEVEALDGAPGVYSARYAGESCSYADNVQKLLMAMNGIENRKACFKTVIAFILDGNEYFFEGKIEGEITLAPRGNHGFGYDSVFQPIGEIRTFAELSDSEKNSMSHRGMALRALSKFLLTAI
jgi:XTP/dITP diphosphohydrolase